MSLFDSPLPVNAAGPWELHEQPHEFLFAKTVFRGQALGLFLDYHLPDCTRGTGDLHNDLADYLRAEVIGLDVGMLPATHINDKNGRYIAYSAMQKSIRRGDALLAWRAAHALMGAKESSSVWRRLLVISMEDVGMGDPYGMAFACRLMLDKALRTELGELKSVWWLIKRLCAAPKSRDLCDTATWCLIKPHMEQPVAFSIGMSGAELVQLAASADFDFQNRLAAVYRLSGKFDTITKHGNPSVDRGLRHFHKAAGVPPLFRYVATKGFKGSGDSMAIILPILWQLFCASTYANVSSEPYEKFRDDVKVGNILAAALDKHTWAGKIAIHKFVDHPPIRAWLAAHPWVNVNPAIERAVFYTEGGLLAPRLFYDGALALYDQILDAKMISNGFQNPAEGLEFYAWVGASLSVLHKLRGAA